MVGQERAAHSAAECSVGEDTHVQTLHCVHVGRAEEDGNVETSAVWATQAPLDSVPDRQRLEG